MLYEEWKCVHSRTDECGEPVCQTCHGPWAHEPGCRYANEGKRGTAPCPGGSRREVVLNMVAVIDHLIEEFAITDMVDRDTLLAHAHDMELAALRPPVSSSRDGEET